MDVLKLLNQVKNGEITAEDAAEKLRLLSGEDLGFAVIDHERQLRTGCAEVIYCEGKTPEWAAEIFLRLSKMGSNVLATRASLAHFAAVSAVCPGAVYNETARVITYNQSKIKLSQKTVAVCTGGTADIPVAEEAAETARIFGASVIKIYDVGVAGLHRMINRLPDIQSAGVVIAVAGMEGALPSVLAGLVDVPVIAVPTSVGYGTGMGGLAAMLTMLNSCAAGIGVVNIDNGFGAGRLASLINQMEAC